RGNGIADVDGDGAGVAPGHVLRQRSDADVVVDDRDGNVGARHGQGAVVVIRREVNLELLVGLDGRVAIDRNRDLLLRLVIEIEVTITDVAIVPVGEGRTVDGPVIDFPKGGTVGCQGDHGRLRSAVSLRDLHVVRRDVRLRVVVDDRAVDVGIADRRVDDVIEVE